jgi:CubicO group peptidase (beta-lactamase class C family)
VRSRPVTPLLCLTLLCLGSQALLPAQSGPPDSAAITNAFAAELRSRLDLPGIAVAVGGDGRVVANEMLGWSDVEGQIPVRPASLFPVGSLSKLLTATVALRLRQAGTFDLDAPLHRYLTAVPEAKANITARQLLGHLAGFPHYGEMAFSSQRDQDGKDTNVGLAWRIGRDENGRRYVHHGGDAVGGRAFLLVYPDIKVAVAITTNIGSAAFNEKDALVAARPFVH